MEVNLYSSERSEAEPLVCMDEASRQLQADYTPGNGSWLNVAETELSVLSRQCLARRIPSVDKLTAELQAWQQQRNEQASKVIWRFSTEDARVKLKHLYPVFEAVE